MRRTLFALCAGLLACASDEIVIATLALDASTTSKPDADATLDAGTSLADTCRAQAECPSDEYCLKDACDAPTGRCARRPTICDREPSPVCGCDGITYYNDCLRAQGGVTARGPGDCPRETAVRCGGRMGLGCPESSFCARLVLSGPECPPDLLGTCWVVPECDPNPRGGERFVACPTVRDGPSSDDDCVDVCTAIRSELPHIRRFRCDRDDRSGRSDM